MDKITVQCKLPGTITYKDIAEVDVKDKNGNTVSYAYTDEVSEPGAYTYRIKAVSYKNKTFLTNDVTVDVAPAQGTGSFQFGKLTISSSDPMSTSFSESQSVAPNVFMGTMTNYNSAYYSKLLKKYRGKGLKEYVQDVRLKKACELLTSTDLPVRTISEEVGYLNTNFFYHLFEDYAGCSPRDYRAKR